MKYSEAIRLIKSDYARYVENVPTNKRGLKALLRVLLHERGFRYTIWLRLAAVRGCLLPLCWLVYHHLSSKFGIQIPRTVKIGEGLMIGHGVGIVVNGSTTIGKNVTICQFLSIGSVHGKAATIEDDVYIGPSVCLVEDVTLGRGCKIGAGSVVTHDVPPYATAVGVPAKVIKR